MRTFTLIITIIVLSISWGCENEGLPACEEVTLSNSGILELFECPTGIVQPCDVVMYKDYYRGEQLSSLLGRIRQTALGKVDLEALVDCVDPGNTTSCLEASGNVPGGGEFEYRIEITEIGNPTYGSALIREYEWISVDLPDEVEAWTHLSYAFTDGPRNTDMDGHPMSDVDQFEVTWTGELDPEWPVDSNISGSFQENYNQDEFSLLTPDCFKRIYHDEDIETGGPTEWIMTFDDVEVHVSKPDVKGQLTGWVDNDCIGTLEPSDWSVIGECLI